MPVRTQAPSGARRDPLGEVEKYSALANRAELEAGEDGTSAMERERAAGERPEVMSKASRFRGIHPGERSKAQPWR